MVVLDLDFTLICKDTFKAWVWFLLKKSILSFSLNQCGLILYLMLCRFFKFTNHIDFKKKMMQLHISPKWHEAFVDKVIMHLNQQVVLHVQETITALGDPQVVIATAAPCTYAQYFPKYLQFKVDKVIGSFWDKKKFVNNEGETKQRNLENSTHSTCDVFYTDHYIDLPVMKNSKKTFLVNPSQATLSRVSSNHINFESLYV
ncbi:MAG: HAD family hydrolase [Bdellovibrionota bacterium]